MASLFKRLIGLKIRKQRRYKVTEGVYVTYEQSLSKNQVENLSLGGLSFYYVDDGTRIDGGSCRLSLFTKNDIRVGNVPFKAVSDIDTGELIFNKKKIKRQGVCFEKLSQPQKDQLKKIIRIYGMS